MRDKTIAVVILTNDEVNLLKETLGRLKNGILAHSYNVYIGYNGIGRDGGLLEIQLLANALFPGSHKIIEHDKYHFPANTNDIVKNHLNDEEYVLFMINDVFIEPNGSVGEMVKLLENNDTIGTVGTRLLYGDMKTIQHDGLRIMFTPDKKDYAMVHINQHMNHDETPRAQVISTLGNTFAFCMMNREVFLKMDGLNEEYEKCFEDVEFNMKLLKNGYENVTISSNYHSFHLESYTRNKVEGDLSQDDMDRVGNYMRDNMFDVESFTNRVEIVEI